MQQSRDERPGTQLWYLPNHFQLEVHLILNKLIQIFSPNATVIPDHNK